MKIFWILFSFFLFIPLFQSQEKILNIQETEEKIKIDGQLNESVWQNADIATSFTEFRPNNGAIEKTGSPTKIRVTYDNKALYFGIECTESNMDSLNTRLSNRDNVGNDTDWFIIQLNPFNDNQQYFQFGVSAAGVQFDSFAALGSGEDWSWNAIWDSAVKITDTGYIIEVEIPYSAIRFPKQTSEEWAINFVRNFSKNRKLFTWQAVDNEQGTIYQYHGNISGIKKIEPPTRLFFIPFLSDYYTISNGEKQNSLKGGVDLNWGINRSFVLDATLIPDFGQAGFDNVQYILGPFEQQFSDKRPFFTDGMDLFRKGNLLYTRRIGQAPSFYPDLGSNEEIIEYPNETQLLNSIKVSGRGENGLGIGVLNAITDRADATIYNSETNTVSKEIVSPYTNYSEIVFDKRFKESSSSFSLVNTNVTRNGSYRDANVSAFIADLYDKDNKYNLYSQGNISLVHEYGEDKVGYYATGSANKDFGKNRYGIGGSYASKEYDKNDMGINFYNNYWDIYGYFNNRLLESNEVYNTKNINTNVNARFDLATGLPYYFEGNFNFNSTNRKNNYNGFGLSFSPMLTYDFYEPRVDGRYSQDPATFSIWYYNSPNYNKKFLIDKSFNFGWGSFKNQYYYGIGFNPRYRPSDKLLLTFDWSYGYDSHDRGWVDQVGDNIIFGARNRKTITTYIQGDYYFNPYASLSLNFRHYYTNATYKQFYFLNDDGSYTKDRNYTGDPNFTFNTWNVDLKFSWWFAPGSQMEILYRNTFDSYLDRAENNLADNFQFLFDQPLTQIFSIRLTYFLDYNKAKAFIKGRKTRSKNHRPEKLNAIMNRNKATFNPNSAPHPFLD